MIKLGKLTDYAVAVMVQLSKEGEGAAQSAHQLAQKTGIPEPTVAKVLKKLASEKLLESVRGAAGGYKLAADKEYSLCDVIEAMDGPIAVVTCLDAAGESCKSEVKCPAHGRWEPVNTAIRATLQKISLSALATGGCSASYDFIQKPLQPTLPERVEKVG